MTATRAKTILKAVPYFAGVADSEIEALLEASTLLDCQKDEYIFFRGDRAEEFYILMTGCVRTYRDADIGDLRVLDEPTSLCNFHPVFNPGDNFGAATCLSRDAASYPYSAKAVKKSRLIAVPAAALEQLRKANPEVGTRMTQAEW